MINKPRYTKKANEKMKPVFLLGGISFNFSVSFSLQVFSLSLFSSFFIVSVSLFDSWFDSSSSLYTTFCLFDFLAVFMGESGPSTDELK